MRFVTHKKDPRSGRRQGLFAAARDLRESGRLSLWDEQRLDALREWFADNLPVPNRFSVSARPNRKSQAISWFKSTSKDSIAHIRDYAAVLEEYGVLVEMIQTARPGFVVYEDPYQIVAYPFADTDT
ncbi:hypothetical protein [Methylopila sp. Yamaguchi]|uniref:hypothetical protein n=1 Tax=Methylopila sp. Yamaguchi TaxID=1437817 RepID=UPI0011AEF477|nr:hypothetical protein [Methylopila sp. Yamaguchi]